MIENANCFRSHRILTEKQAKEIYRFHLISLESPPVKVSGSPSAQLAALYHVSPKTIRDIWSGRTWTDATSHVSWTRNDLCYQVNLSVNRKFSYLC